MMDEDQLSIDALPDEILLNIFRMLPANEFVVCIPLVCEKWCRIIASDSYTLQRIGMRNVCMVNDFFYLGDERDMFHWPRLRFEQLIQTFAMMHYSFMLRGSRKSAEFYGDVFYTWTRYPEICEHITTLMISTDIRMFAVHRLMYIDRLTKLGFYNVSFYKKDQHTLAEMGNVRDAIYVKCYVKPGFDPKFLHSGFSRLQRFRADLKSLDINFLEGLLHTHRQTLETVDLRDCAVFDDQWIDVLSQRLRGRTVNRLTIRSPNFTDKLMKQFIATVESVLPDDKSNVIIDIQIDCYGDEFFDVSKPKFETTVVEVLKTLFEGYDNLTK